MEETMPQAQEILEQEVEIQTSADEDVAVVEVDASGQEHEQEIEQYSDKVQKRIDKLTYNHREAERQRDEAIRVAQTLRDQVKDFEQKIETSDKALFQEYNGRVVTELEQVIFYFFLILLHLFCRLQFHSSHLARSQGPQPLTQV